MNDVDNRRSSVASTSILEAPSCQSYGDKVLECWEAAADSETVERFEGPGAGRRLGTTKGAVVPLCACTELLGKNFSVGVWTGVLGDVVGGEGNKEMLIALSAIWDSNEFLRR